MSDTKKLSRSLPHSLCTNRSLRIPEFLVARRRLPGTDMHASRRIPVEVVAVALCEYVVANDRPMSVTYGVVRQYLANG
jgi:hypothetical protein